jgi:hypothetical protein
LAIVHDTEADDMVEEFVVVLMADGIGRAILLVDVGGFVTYIWAGIHGDLWVGREMELCHGDDLYLELGKVTLDDDW